MERGPPIWYSGLRPPFAPPVPRLFAKVCVEYPKRGLVRVIVGKAEIRMVEEVKELAPEAKV